MNRMLSFLDKKTLLTLFVWVGMITNCVGQISDLIYNPQNLWLLDEGDLLINDIAANDDPLRVFDLQQEILVKSIRSGKGPGEVSPKFYKRITRFSNGDVLLWDAGLKRITRYSSKLDYIDDITGSGLRTNFYQVGLINDSTLLTIDFTEEFLKAWRIRNNEVKSEDLLWSININKHEELSPLSNFILLQTLFFQNSDGMLYMTCEYSSHVIGINEEGIVFINNEPDNISIPVNDKPEEDPVYSLPVLGEQPEGARDISTGGNYVYLLLNGETISHSEQKKYLSNIDALVEKINHAERLLVYNGHNGEFIKEIKLPMPARQAKVQGEHIFLLNTLGDAPVVKKYKLSEL